MKSRKLQENQNKVCLYIATHNKTCLKYFGKTIKYFTQEELQKYYHGSGPYWLDHLNVHGDDVTMEIYGIYKIDEVEEVALKFSEDNNIAKALNESGDREGKKIWANVKPENGLDGGDNSSFIDYEKIAEKNKITKASQEWKEKMRPVYQKIGSKAIETQLNDIDENGLNGIQRRSLKISETNKGNPKLSLSMHKTIKRMKDDIDEDGNNEYDKMVSKRMNDMKNNIDKNNLNTFQRAGIKGAEKRMNTFVDGSSLTEIASRKAAETMRKTITENGKTIEENRVQNLKEALREKSIIKHGLYKLNNSDKLYTMSEIKEISQTLIKHIGKPLFTSKLGLSYARKNNKEHLIGVYVEEQYTRIQ
jgi:hypothetical protein